MPETKKGPFLVRIARNFLLYRELLYELIIKDLKKKYKKSFLGYLWSVLNPLLTMVVLVAVFSNVLGRGVDNFPIYLLTGQLMFNMCSVGTRAAMGSITGNASLIQKVYIPKYILPLSSIFSALINQLFSFVALIIVMLATRFVPTATILLFFVPIIYQFIFCFGLGLALATLLVFFRDIEYIYGIFLTLWMYLTPVFYHIDIIGGRMAKVISTINPMYHYITYMRDLVMYGQIPDLRSNLICLGFALVSLLIGVALFYKNQSKFVLYI